MSLVGFNRRQVHLPYVNLYRTINDYSSLETQLLHGETFHIIESTDTDWLKIRADLEGYEGYIKASDASKTRVQAMTHRVIVPRAIVYAEPSFKSERYCELAMNAKLLFIGGQSTPEGNMLQHQLGWIFADQTARDVWQPGRDFVDVALMFIGTSYVWGWRAGSIDCSALVQQSCVASGIPCERDAGPQSRTLGEEIPDFLERGMAVLKRGDFVFWTEGKGRHVVIMIDNKQCVHATIAAPHRGVVVQPLRQVMYDQERDGNNRPTIARRLPNYR